MHECDRQTHRQMEGHLLTASSALEQRLKINDDGTKEFEKLLFSKYYFILYFQNTFSISIFILYCENTFSALFYFVF